MTDRMKEYYYLKSKDICVRCRKEKALTGRTLCYECTEKDIEKSKRYREKNHSKIRQKENARWKIWRSKGLCGRCGKVHTGEKSLCTECSIKKNRYLTEKKRSSGHIDRSIRVELGKCYYCGDVAIEGKKVCKQHYESRVKAIIENRKNVDTEKHYFRGNKI